ncbi:ornithine-acyl[acyl carrier protein] N-acyltransferase [Cognatiyoonia koreensis]|uniref:L-ornithine N(alpha)-acyltransferase n=1 Tax=Cognatiyoonia koreensis TaxID=364200 RepID=A0A1I0PAS5_9RHOB|nr:GNAT family N-acyltransferase [Cognatiyoonia koreensis]SEW11246.1 ornithine-acyl[acyl carrier protein] N-acyltransferase [Cognatiyoonia koreensis]
MASSIPQFQTHFARNDADILAAQRLRYDVFVKELGAVDKTFDGADRVEKDAFDKYADHLLLRDLSRPQSDQIVGVYRLMNAKQAELAGEFSTEREYDIAALKMSGKCLLELGRSCLHRDYRGGSAMFHIWQSLADHIEVTGTEILFGVASFHGIDPMGHAASLNMLFADHNSAFAVPSRQHLTLPVVNADKKEALRQTPALIKAYLRLGGTVGQGAYVDREFNTTDVCMILDVANMNDRHRAIYAR